MSDLVGNHIVGFPTRQLNYLYSAEALEQNQMLEFERNGERFVFLKVGKQTMMQYSPRNTKFYHFFSLGVFVYMFNV